MAIIYADSFDHYALGDADEKGWGSGISAIESAAGRFTNGARLRVQTSVARSLPSPLTTIIAGFAFRYTGSGQTGDVTIIEFYEGSTVHVNLGLKPSSKLYVTRANTQLGSNGTATISPNQWYYIEVKFTINDSTGVAVVKVNGVTDINLSSQDTRNGGTGVIDQFKLWSVGYVSGTDAYFDDLVILDTSGGAPNNDFIGDVRVEALFPNGNGNSSQLVGSDGNSTDNYLLVDESTPNGDTDYVESSTVGDKDTYAYSNLTPTTGTVYAVQPCVYAKKTDAGVRSMVSVARHSGSEVDSSAFTLNTTYNYFMDVRDTKPGGGTWSISDVNGAEFGAKVNA